MSEIKLIVGLGNPGDKYADTRHNAGEWLVERLARRFNVSLNPENKFLIIIFPGQSICTFDNLIMCIAISRIITKTKGIKYINSAQEKENEMIKIISHKS